MLSEVTWYPLRVSVSKSAGMSTKRRKAKVCAVPLIYDVVRQEVYHCRVFALILSTYTDMPCNYWSVILEAHNRHVPSQNVGRTGKDLHVLSVARNPIRYLLYQACGINSIDPTAESTPFASHVSPILLSASSLFFFA